MNQANEIQLVHDSFVSLHVQLHNQLRQLIVSGRWEKGSLIPSETEFTRYFSISRSTVRLALQQIEIEGLIERRPGKGTFVAYQPSQDGQHRLIAYITNDFNNASAVNLLNGAQDEVHRAGYHVTFNNVRNAQDEVQLLTRLQEDRVAGVLVWPSTDWLPDPQPHIQRYQSLHVPLVFIDRDIPGVACDCVTSDNYAGASALMHHLLELGHERIVFLSHPRMPILPVMERYRAYQDVMRAAGFSPEAPWLIGEEREMSRGQALNASTDPSSLEFQQITTYFLNAHPRPTAIFALNDYMAILAMRVMKFLNIRVPHEISIVGFDDIDLADHLEVPLTTVAQDPFAIGKRAAQLLIDRLEGCRTEVMCETIPTQLRVRSSTAVLMPV